MRTYESGHPAPTALSPHALHVHPLLPVGSTRTVWTRGSPIHSSESVAATVGGTVEPLIECTKGTKKSDPSSIHHKHHSIQCITSITSINQKKNYSVRCCHNGWYGATCTSRRQKRQSKHTFPLILVFALAGNKHAHTHIKPTQNPKLCPNVASMKSNVWGSDKSLVQFS